MKDIKIKGFRAKGLRGFKTDVTLPLNEKSIVLYGDNGTGKSSVADILEWFFYDRIDHLSGREIGRNGLEAMRHTSLAETDDAIFSIRFKHPGYDCEKTLFIKKGVVNNMSSNCNDEFVEYLKNSGNEKLIIRYKELSNFVLATQGDRLNYLSEIIGFAEVTETKKKLNTIHNKLDKELKTSGFERIIQNSQQTLIKYLRQNIVNEKQFIDTINQVIKDHRHSDTITSVTDILGFIEKLKTPVDQKKLSAIALLETLKNVLAAIEPSLKSANADYEAEVANYNVLVDDAENLKSLKLTDLLVIAEKILMVDTAVIEQCPLCLSEKNGVDLLAEVQGRVEELQEVKNKKAKIEATLKELSQKINDDKQKLKSAISDATFKDEFEELRSDCIAIGLDLKTLGDAIETVNYEAKLIAKLTFKAQTLYKPLVAKIDQKTDEIRKSLPKDTNTELIVMLTECKNNYAELLHQRSLQAKIENQKTTFNILCNEFGKRQKEALETFFTAFSKNINDYYVFMNPGETVENIRLLPVEADDELTGLTIQFEFDKQDVTPPHKFLSESHLNCLGLSFFLASVVAFNKINKFFVLDDVISSFDSSHRKRFLDLLVEKFRDYQIILLTHENNFFEYAKVIAKTNGWLIDSFKYSKEKGTYLSEPKKSVYDRIIKKLNDGDDDKLAHDIRVYLENLSKEIASAIEAKVSFRYNDLNEDRMSPELLNEIKSRLTKSSKGTDGLLDKTQPVLTRSLASNFIGNKDSHDSHFVASLGDCKAFWNDVMEIETTFRCSHCETIINKKYYSVDSKEIKCRCGKLKYNWND